MPKYVKWTGRLSGITKCGRFGIVKLNKIHDGFELAVISDETAGRISIMNDSPRGQLESGTAVVVKRVERGGDAFHVLEVALA